MSSLDESENGGFSWMDEAEIAEGEIVLGDEPWVEAFRRPLHQTPDYAVGVNPYYRPFQILLATTVHRAAGPTPRSPLGPLSRASGEWRGS